MSARRNTVRFDAATGAQDAPATETRPKRDNASLSFDLPDFSWDAPSRMWGGASQPTGSSNAASVRSPRRQALLLTLGIWLSAASCFAGGSYLAREIYYATLADAGDDRAGENR